MTPDSVRNKTARLSGFLGLQRNTVAVLAMVSLVGMGERMAERFLPIYIMALGGSAVAIGLLQAMDNLLSALYSFPGGYLSDRIGTKRALVVGGGISGMAAAKSLANQGYETHIIERSPQLGGQALNLYKTVTGEEIQPKLSGLVEEVQKNKNIHVHLDTSLAKVEGFVGNFEATLSNNGSKEKLDFGVAVMATGAAPLKPDEYHYGDDPRILSSLELDRKFMDNDPSLKDLNCAVFIQCVGSREPDRPYCSKVCCMYVAKQAMAYRRAVPEGRAYVFYIDIRSQGLGYDEFVQQAIALQLQFALQDIQ